jgi:hypothetical protein
MLLNSVIETLKETVPGVILGCVSVGTYSYFDTPRGGYLDFSLTFAITGCLEGALLGASVNFLYNTVTEG